MIRDIVKKCTNCLSAAEARKHSKLTHLCSSTPLKHRQIDTIGAIVEKDGKKQYIMLAVDLATRWVVGRLIKQKSAENITRAIRELIIEPYGKVDIIQCDAGREYNNKILKEYLNSVGTKLEISSPYHHQSTGRIERTIRTFLNILRKTTGCGKLSIKSKIHDVLNAMNLSFSRTIGMSPHMAVYSEIPEISLSSNSIPGKKLNRARLADIRKKYKNVIKTKLKINIQRNERFGRGYGCLDLERNKK